MLDKLAQHFQSNFYPDMSVEDVRAHLDNPEVLQNAFNHVAENGHNDTHVESIAKGNVKRKAQKGYKEKSFTKGGTWKIVKDLKDYKTHEQGGVDLVIGKKGVEVKNGKTQFYAKDGLVMPAGEDNPIKNRIKGNFKPKEVEKIKEHEDFMSSFIKSPRYNEMLQGQGLSKEEADKLVQERYNNVKTSTYGNDERWYMGNDAQGRKANTSSLENDSRGYNISLPSAVFRDEYAGSYGNTANPITHELTHRSLGFTGDKENITPFAREKVSGLIGGVLDFQPNLGSEDFNPNNNVTPEHIKKSEQWYWSNPQEALSRLNGARKMLYDKGVYDPKTEKIDEDKYKLFKRVSSERLKELGSKKGELSDKDWEEYIKLKNINEGLRYINDSIDEKTDTDKQNEDNTNKKIVWMLNNLVHNDTKGENTNV